MAVFVPILTTTPGVFSNARYNVFFPSALTLAHLALAIAASRAFTAGLIRRSGFLATFGAALAPFTLAHLALAAAAILARPAADMWRFFGAVPAAGALLSPPPAKASSWPCSFSIFSLIAMIRWSWVVVKS